MLQGQRDLVTVGKLLLSELAPLVNAQQGSVYQMLSEVADAAPALSLLAGYAIGDDQARRIEVGQRPGRPVRAREAAHPDHQGAAQLHEGPFEPRRARRPKNIVVLPVLFEGETKAVIELSSLQPFTADPPRPSSSS